MHTEKVSESLLLTKCRGLLSILSWRIISLRAILRLLLTVDGLGVLVLALVFFIVNGKAATVLLSIGIDALAPDSCADLPILDSVVVSVVLAGLLLRYMRGISAKKAATSVHDSYNLSTSWVIFNLAPINNILSTVLDLFQNFDIFIHPLRSF